MRSQLRSHKDDRDLTEAGLKRRRLYASCQSCRSCKTKCSGERPACARCSAKKIACMYDSNSRRKRNDSMTSDTSLSTQYHVDRNSQQDINGSYRSPSGEIDDVGQSHSEPTSELSGPSRGNINVTGVSEVGELSFW